MTVSGVGNTGTAGTGTTTSAATSNLSSTLNMSFSTYLKILTTQLQNQDPTNATDPNQFTQELVQMGAVQQQIQTNQDLSQLVAAQSSGALAQGVGYIGNYVQSPSSSNALALQNGSSEFGYTLASAAHATTINIEDASGNVVDTISGGTVAGANYATWDGKDSNGNQMPDGAYTFAVTSTDANGNSITVSNPVALARITGVQSASDGTLNLLAGSLAVSSADVTAVYTPSSLPGATGTAAS